jgi:hypothetical protein
MFQLQVIVFKYSLCSGGLGTLTELVHCDRNIKREALSAALTKHVTYASKHK